jgi:LPXTG-site transpeptidase (sortase) family protein
MKKIITLCLSLCMTAALAAPAYALEYSIDAPDDYDFGRNTSIEVIHTADGGAMRNEDVSKNAALIPPAFGSESMNALHTGEYLTPNLAPRTLPTAGAVISGSGDVVTPGSTVSSGNGYQPAVLFTEVASDLYYKNGSLGRLEIPALDLSVRICQGTDSAALVKGAGHFTNTSIWDGNVAIAGHNRGVNNHFGKIHTLNVGDTIKLMTKLGERSYEVYSVAKIGADDTSVLNDSAENIITLVTCVMNQPDYRWCVQARQK